MAKDFYDILGVAKSANQDEIKKAFHKLAHQHHPDKDSGNADKFKEANEAYQTLSNPEKRKQYDQFGSAFGASGGPGGFNYSDFARAQGNNPFGGFQPGGFNNVNFDFGDLGDVFSSFFGGAQTRTRKSKRGDDVEIELAVDFEEAVFGAEKIIDLQKKILCDRCGGNGAEPGSKINTCPTCGGSGQTIKSQQTIFGNFQTQAICANCRGAGKIREKKCAKCNGAGVAYGAERIKVKIPAGIANRQALKLSGKGEPASTHLGEPAPGGMAGDLYITIRVRPSKEFKRQGDDILSQYHISIRQAVLGDKVNIETVDGPVKLKIPEGTQSQTKFKLRDKGVPQLNSRGRGDQIVEIIVDIPKNISKKQKTLLDELNI
ncbi:molecular chaperone DnaJ [Candidatus Falkowbacteria bacterium]|nr:molecular chaperone DnaJ [Candidatus Falkowbacteria bacterium]